jgi:hypothetical protein
MTGFSLTPVYSLAVESPEGFAVIGLVFAATAIAGELMMSRQ